MLALPAQTPCPAGCAGRGRDEGQPLNIPLGSTSRLRLGPSPAQESGTGQVTAGFAGVSAGSPGCLAGLGRWHRELPPGSHRHGIPDSTPPALPAEGTQSLEGELCICRLALRTTGPARAALWVLQVPPGKHQGSGATLG